MLRKDVAVVANVEVHVQDIEEEDEDGEGRHEAEDYDAAVRAADDLHQVGLRSVNNGDDDEVHARHHAQTNVVPSIQLVCVNLRVRT